mmetsp:Transcript_33469/g.49907  ORF Transcript_33469/g.49907 Transcript_33469/m.49907 type:complete len:117 (-) Transcript_33469:99-449(-)
MEALVTQQRLPSTRKIPSISKVYQLGSVCDHLVMITESIMVHYRTVHNQTNSMVRFSPSFLHRITVSVNPSLFHISIVDPFWSVCCKPCHGDCRACRMIKRLDPVLLVPPVLTPPP